jgi:hypothetical protein
MAGAGKLPDNIREALNQGVLNRLPLTFLPFVNQQLHQWEFLFPNERKSVEGLLLYVVRLSPEESAALFHNVVDLEEKMGVRHWQFSTDEQTIQNSSELARSPYFQDWRRAVQAVFDAAARGVQESNGQNVRAANRLILLDIPRNLALNGARTWDRWQGIGRSLKIDFGQSESAASAIELLLTGARNSEGAPIGGLLHDACGRAAASPADTWVVDASSSLVESAAALATRAVLLSYGRLDQYRQSFSHEMNTMRKDLADADAVFDRLRKVDVLPWCPPEVASEPAVREFVRSLYLSGNGAVIFGNSFVEWAASEAFRRARPTFLAARFGVRSKPKPFTGVAVFDNPDKVNPLPSVDDLEGSAIDAQMLSLYVWLAAIRYEEYQRSTACVCIAESISQAYIVAPQQFVLPGDNGAVKFDRLRNALREWIGQNS